MCGDTKEQEEQEGMELNRTEKKLRNLKKSRRKADWRDCDHVLRRKILTSSIHYNIIFCLISLCEKENRTKKGLELDSRTERERKMKGWQLTLRRLNRECAD